MVISKKLVFAFVALLISSAPVLAQINPNSLEQSKYLRLVLNAAQCANIPQSNKQLSKSGAPPIPFVKSVKQLKRVEDLKTLVYILDRMQNGEASLNNIDIPLWNSFFHTIDLIAKKKTPEAQEALDCIRRECRTVRDGGGSLTFKQICRNHKMKCLIPQYKIIEPLKTESEDLRK